MVSQWNAQGGCHPQQLPLALGEPLGGEAQKVHTIPGDPTRRRRPRDVRGRFMAVAVGAAKPRRERPLPSRDSRGRFVACPTSDAPSWYVFCCDGYRIPEEPPAPSAPLITPVAPHALPRAIVRPRYAWLSRSHLENAILFVFFVITLALYWWHLPPARW